MDQEETILVKEEESIEVSAMPAPAFPEDPLKIEKPTFHIKQDPELKVVSDDSDHKFLEGPLGVSWSTDFIKTDPELNLGAEETEEIDLKYEMESAISYTDQESNPVEGETTNEGGRNPSTGVGLNVGTGGAALCTAEQEKSCGNDGKLVWLVPSCKVASIQLWDHKQQVLVDGSYSPYSCSACQKKFSKRRNWKRHIRSHVIQRPFSCCVCNKAFTQSSHLRCHSLLHTGQRPYSCSDCDKTFTRSSHLKRHSLLHTGQRLYSCSVCDKEFTRDSNLKRHLLQHTEQHPYSCSVCNKTFTRSDDLNRHAVQHTG